MEQRFTGTLVEVTAHNLLICPNEGGLVVAQWSHGSAIKSVAALKEAGIVIGGTITVRRKESGKWGLHTWEVIPNI